MVRSGLVAPAAAFVLGSLASMPLSRDFMLVILAALSLLCANALFEQVDGPRIRALIAGALVAGALNSYLHGTLQRSLQGGFQTVSGMVDGDVQDETWGSAFPLKLDTGRTISVSAVGHAPSPGMHLAIRGRIEPFDESRNPEEPSAASFATERGLDARLSKGHIVRVLAPAPDDLHSFFARTRALASLQLHASLSEPYASILAGEMWGERSTLPPDIRAEFQDTGTVHILVTAGLHLGVVAMCALWLCSLLHLPRKAACFCVASAVWTYVLFSGSHVPSLRAATMITFALCARACGRKALSWNSLAAAAMVVAICWPPILLSASFALSFSCVGSIILLAPHIDAWLERYDGIPARLREAVTLTFATQAGVWPLTAATFLLFSPYAVLANLAVVPCVGATMMLGFAQLLFGSFPLVGHAVSNLNEWLLTYIVSVVRCTAGLPYAHVVMTPPPTWTIASYDVVLVCSAWLYRQRRYAVGAFALAAAIALIVAPPRPGDHQLRVTVLDVGQADGIVIQTPTGHVFLVDAGGRLERGPTALGNSIAEAVGERVVVPFLIRHGIHHLDGIFISHPHGDHAGGVAPVLRTLNDDNVIDSGQHYMGFAYRDAMEVARLLDITVRQPRAGASFETDDGVAFDFLGPSIPLLAGTRNDINNNSLIFMLRYKSFRMLFTGDAGAEAEQRVLGQGVDLQADVLKVGHHGSAYSSTPAFINAVHPKYAVISVGRHNLFGHPASKTIETLERLGARVYRTDQNGALTIFSDGLKSSIATMIQATGS
ncbi:MAG: DNA internalization-related competence protein ComEC/Rec2 [Candidatus Eremiobacteraeota bacterium]|nr:DNA internalization-related competence protein ComEC/Rec2 [Candidatus Eremiobacteraeota bacterium]